MKRFLIAGNWKMNKTTAQAVHYVHELKAQKLTNPESVAIIAPFTQLEALKKELEGTDVKVCTVVGFPLGQMSTKAKATEAAIAVEDGADEIDMVINVAALKDGEEETVYQDILAVRRACEKQTLKVIIETCLLTDDEKRTACRLAEKAGADFVKTSTGFSTGGATTEDVALMRSEVGTRLGVKASGGIRDKETAQRMIDAGASRLGTSATIAICS